MVLFFDAPLLFWRELLETAIIFQGARTFLGREFVPALLDRFAQGRREALRLPWRAQESKHESADQGTTDQRFCNDRFHGCFSHGRARLLQPADRGPLRGFLAFPSFARADSERRNLDLSTTPEVNLVRSPVRCRAHPGVERPQFRRGGAVCPGRRQLYSW